MEISKTITQISNLIIDQTIQQPRPLDELKKELNEKATQIRAMKTIVSMTQQNYDTSSLLSDVIKIIDTNNYELKILCNYYLKIICFNRPACLVMCTNTFFKDFNDRNPKIQQLALIDSVELFDEILIKNYIKDIKRMGLHPKSELRMLACRSLSMFYLKNKSLYQEENLNKCLIELLKDNDEHVRISSLRAINVIEYYEEIVSFDELLKMATDFWESGNTNGLRCTLNILKKKKLNTEIQCFILKALKHYDIVVFYICASKLIENELFYQEIYEQAVGFMDASIEQLHNLFVFLYPILDRFKFRCSDFFMRNTDSELIRFLKLKCLIKIFKINFRQNLELEKYIKSCIFNENSKKMVANILDCAIKLNCFVPDVIRKKVHSDILIEVIYKNMKIIQDNNAVDELLQNVTKTRLNQKFIILATEFCSKVPDYIFKINIEENCHLLMRFFVKMMNNEIITEEQCRKYLKNMQKDYPSIHRIGIVLDRINTIDPEDICNYELTDLLKCESSDENNILFDDEVEIEWIQSKSNSNIKINPEDNIQYNKTREDYINNEKPHHIDSLPVYIDTTLLKGTMSVENDKFILSIDILEKNEIIRYSLGSIEHEEEITREGKYVLFEVTDDTRCNEYKIKIGNMVYCGQI